MFIDVTTLEQLEEIKKLVLIKKKPNRKPFPKTNALYSKCGQRCDLCIHYTQVDIAAGDWVYLNFCVGNVGDSVEAQVHGALDNMEARLALVGLTLESVIKVDELLRNLHIKAAKMVYRCR